MKIFGFFLVLGIFAVTVRCAEKSNKRPQRSVNMFLEKRKPPASTASKSEAASKEELSKKVPRQERHQATTNSEDSRQGRLWRDSQSSYRDRRRSFYYGGRRSDLETLSQSDPNLVGFSAVRAARDSLTGRKGRINFENTIADMNRGWESRESVFRCRVPGLYFFSLAARGRVSYFDDDYGSSNSLDSSYDENNVIDDAVIIEEARRIRYRNMRNREADRDACLDWKVSLMLNGEAVVSIGGQNNTSSSNSVILPLNYDDRVYLQLLRGQLIEVADNYAFRGSSGMTTFSGYKIGGVGGGGSFYPSTEIIGNFDNRPPRPQDDSYESEIISSRRRSGYYPTSNGWERIGSSRRY